MVARYKRYIIIYLPLLLLIFFNSCQPILKVLWGVRTPRYENEAKLNAYLTKNFDEIPTHSYTLDSLDWRKLILSKDITYPDLLLFDKNGNRIPEKGLCIPYSQNFVDTLISIHQRNFIKENENLKFQDFEKMFRNYKGQHVIPGNNEKHYKGILIWAAFLGKGKGLKQAKSIIIYVNNSRYDIDLFFLNVDMQSYWKDKSNQ